MTLVTQANPLLLSQSGARQLAFDGCYYYLCLFAQKKILKLSSLWEEVEVIETKQAYDALCFDSKHRCFWASSWEQYHRLYRLDCQLRELDCLCFDYGHYGTISSLSYHCCHDSIYVACACGLLEYQVESGSCTPLPYGQGLLTATLALCPGYFTVTREKNRQTLSIFLEDGSLLSETALPISPSVESLVYNPCGQIPRIDSLLSGCYPKISSQPVTSHDLGFEPCICNLQACQNCCPACPSQAVTDVLESIALMEASLAHILNAEGEKIQKIVAEATTGEEMIAVNSSVESMVQSVTQLEAVLCSKLEALVNLEYSSSCHPLACPDIE